MVGADKHGFVCGILNTRLTSLNSKTPAIGGGFSLKGWNLCVGFQGGEVFI
jgi:hypothetical protein